MKTHNEKLPNPKEIEKELGDFLAKRFGGSVKMVSAQEVMPHTDMTASKPKEPAPSFTLDFDLKPDELIAWLDQYIVKQEQAKTVLATKICTHFNRIKRFRDTSQSAHEIVGSIKNNVLMIGPTGVGKTYMIRLIAKKIGVPFVKGDATKFSETGYVGGDVEDLVRDLVREANDNIELAEHGIIYIDEIDKIAGSRNIIGADVSRTGVQRALLKPMEETDVDLKIPHDPISMLQEIERFRKTGERDRRVVNTRNILFIVSGAFGDLTEIIKKRIHAQGLGFGAQLKDSKNVDDVLAQVRTEDLVEYGFESEFVGRLPVRAIFERLTESDLYDILRNPNNPVILGKKLDFAAYGIDIKFDDPALRLLAKRANAENTGARGLVSAVESALLLFERRLPSGDVKSFPITADVILSPVAGFERLQDASQRHVLNAEYDRLVVAEKDYIREYLQENRKRFSDRYSLTLTPSRMDIITKYYSRYIMDIGHIISRVKSLYDEIKRMELAFYKDHDINIVLEDDAVDFIIEQLVNPAIHVEDYQKQIELDFEMGLKLIREKTGRNRFFINRKALLNPEQYIGELIRMDMSGSTRQLPDNSNLSAKDKQ
ncbi:MAG: AAA family ATPase [Desulfatirhabdiaceae bacterium]